MKNIHVCTTYLNMFNVLETLLSNSLHLVSVMPVLADIDRIGLAEDRDKCRALLMNAVMNLRDP
jgi:hypothetical protein